MTNLSPASEIECAVTEISEALSVIQLLIPEEAPTTRDQQTLQAVSYVVCSMRGHVGEIQTALVRLPPDEPA